MRPMPVAAALLGAIIAGASPAAAFDWNSRTSFNSELATQRARVADGLRRGTLSMAEARQVRRQHERILAMRNNGTPRVTYSAMLAETSGMIVRLKTN